MTTRDAELRDIILTSLGSKTVEQLTDIANREGIKTEVQAAIVEALRQVGGEAPVLPAVRGPVSPRVALQRHGHRNTQPERHRPPARRRCAPDADQCAARRGAGLRLASSAPRVQGAPAHTRGHVRAPRQGPRSVAHLARARPDRKFACRASSSSPSASSRCRCPLPCSSFLFDIAGTGQKGIIDIGPEFSTTSSTGCSAARASAARSRARSRRSSAWRCARVADRVAAAAAGDLAGSRTDGDATSPAFESSPEILQVVNREDPVLGGEHRGRERAM